MLKYIQKYERISASPATTAGLADRLNVQGFLDAGQRRRASTHSKGVGGSRRPSSTLLLSCESSGLILLGESSVLVLLDESSSLILSCESSSLHLSCESSSLIPSSLVFLGERSTEEPVYGRLTES